MSLELVFHNHFVMLHYVTCNFPNTFWVRASDITLAALNEADCGFPQILHYAAIAFLYIVTNESPTPYHPKVYSFIFYLCGVHPVVHKNKNRC
jgi:hypothetical protein